ncbi:MAG: 4a-hydroxytetrahydrobiopterin dehydratase [Gammaproteobacteria bacterium]|nr:MAG: 4a-hydroxytetrahydrobiopterin dehydratase [Gammaproteobacteria bacterium]
MDLRTLHCRHRGSDERLDADEARELLAYLDPRWSLTDDAPAITAQITLANFSELMLFLQALAWISHTEDHHPEVCYTYRDCTITYSTHSAGGLTRNDFICAVRVDDLLRQYRETRPSDPA